MNGRPLVTVSAVGLACLGILLPAPLLQAAPGSDPPRAEENCFNAPTDVALGAGGVLRGQVVNRQGMPLGQVPVSIRQFPGEVATTVADRSGCFEVGGLRGGTYQVVAGAGTGIFRLWAPETAPPAARKAVLIVADGPQVLGQQGPIAYWFLCHPWLTAGVVAAAVAVPVAIHNHQVDRNRTPFSP